MDRTVGLLELLKQRLYATVYDITLDQLVVGSSPTHPFGITVLSSLSYVF